MKNKLLILGAIAIFSTSCTSLHNSMREPNTHLELSKNDFNISDQVSATASTTKIFGIDFARLFNQKSGSIDHDGSTLSVNASNIPVIGNFVGDKTASYSLYELMKKNPNYDVALYPQFETKVVRPFLGIGFIYKKSTVKTTSRLGQLKK
jgi:hypothetical protein